MSTWAIFWICFFGATVLKTLIVCLFAKTKPVEITITPEAGSDFDLDTKKVKKTKKSKEQKNVEVSAV